MATEDKPGNGAAPSLNVLAQYVKDLSFEVPGAPAIYTQPQGQPQVNLNLDVQARRLDPNAHVYEVVLAIKAEAQPTPAAPVNGQAAVPPPVGPVFIAELSYAGVFTLAGVPDNANIGWYERTIQVPDAWRGKRIFLVVGASDWKTAV